MAINNGQTLTLEALKYLCSVINQTVSLPNNIISDTSIATNTTYSSYLQDKKFTTLEAELKKYADDLVAGMNKLTKEVINDKALATKDNVLYLYKADTDTSNNYMQMMLINGVVVELGTTQVDFSNYYSKTDVDSKFALKLDLDTLTTSFNDLKAKVGSDTLTTTAQTHTGAINELNKNKEDKSNKVTTIDSTSTDTQYPSAKATYDGLNSKVDKSSIATTIDNTSTYDTVASAKAVYDSTITCNLHLENSDYNIDTVENYVATHVNPTNNGDFGTYPTEFEWGTFLQLPARGYRSQILISTQGMYYRIMIGGKWQTWYKVNTTKVTDTTTYPKETT